MTWYDETLAKNPKYLSTALVNDVGMLYPKFALLILKLFCSARKEGLLVRIYETYRSQQRQADLFAKGVTMLQKNGMHHFGIAADIVFLKGNNPSWDPTFAWKRLGALGTALGLEWGGSWTSFVDLPHFQLVPASASEQAKIIQKNYPPFDAGVDMPNLCGLYGQAQASNFSNATIDTLWSALNNVPAQPDVEVFIETIPAPPVPTPVPPRFTRNLSEGMDGDDVRTLQKILNADPATRITSQGTGSPGHESTHFGSLTKAAVQKFQIKYGITSAGSPGYGSVGPLTRKKLEEVGKGIG